MKNSPTGVTEGYTPKVCPICGAEEPVPWFEQPMNEDIRAYARSYIGPPKTFNTSLEAELDDWGIDWRSWATLE